MARTPFAFSPSRAHAQVIRRVRPARRYDGGDLRAWQRRLRTRLRRLLGLRRMPPRRAPLRLRRLWTRRFDFATVEKLVFRSEPGADVPAYLCLPHDAPRPLPVFICLQGHTSGMHLSIGVDAKSERRAIPIDGDRDFAVGCARRGIAALCLEQRSFGERAEREQKQTCPHNTCHDAAMHALMLGRTLAGERVYDVIRAIELLRQRPDLDTRRLGIMGNSGGGLISILAGALIPSIRFMIPSCALCTYRDSILSIYHCADNYIPGLYLEAEMADVLGLFAPRAVVVVNGRTDPIFPIAGARRAFRDLKRIYQAADAPDRCTHVIGPDGHRFYADLAWPRMLTMMRHGGANHA